MKYPLLLISILIVLIWITIIFMFSREQKETNIKYIDALKGDIVEDDKGNEICTLSHDLRSGKPVDWNDFCENWKIKKPEPGEKINEGWMTNKLWGMNGTGYRINIRGKGWLPRTE